MDYLQEWMDMINNLFFQHIDPEEMRADIEHILGEVDLHHAFGIPVNMVEVMGIYTYVLADTFDRGYAYREAIHYVQDVKRAMYN